MCESFRNSYFSSLPNEVLIKILSNIDTLTLLNFCEVYDCDYFLQERNVIKNINLHKKYQLQDLTQISKKINFEAVTSLNVNCLYWVQAAKLRKFVTRLVNLETLYAMQTNLSLSASDTEAFSKSKIKKLSISVDRRDELGTHKMPTVETLYINIVNIKVLFSPLTLDMIFPHLSKLWIEVEESSSRDIILHCLNVENKNKIFCQINAPIPSMNFDHYWLTTYYTNRRACQPYVMCCERFKPKQLGSKNELESSLDCWKVLEELHYSRPFGPKDARKLFLNEDTLDSILFEELNFYHNGPACNNRSQQAVEDILKSSNSKNLKKLCIMMCVLQNKNSLESVNVQDSNGFIRKRIGLETSVASHPVGDIFKNFLGLEHLEIHICHKTAHHGAIQGYPLISVFENLESLNVQIPITLDGSFLIEVLTKCKKLKRVKITSTAQNEKLNYNVCTAISNGFSLKDFRYENHRIQLDKLLDRLCLLKSNNLERIVITCKEVDKFSAGPLKEFLETNPQLVFVYFLIKNCTENAIRMAQQTLNTYKKRHPCKVFFIKKENVFGSLGYPIPDVHFCEMMKTDNDVASLRPSDDFVTF